MLAENRQQHFDAALGWLQLGNWQEAHEELKRLPLDMLATPAVLVLRCRICAHAGCWDEVEMIAEAATDAFPEEFLFYTRTGRGLCIVRGERRKVWKL